MIAPALRHAPALLALIAASGCATPAADPRSPSLLPRPIETRSDAEPEIVAVVAAPDPATDAKAAALSKQLGDNAALFDKAAAAADRSANLAKGDAVGGERWIAAQSALADLDVLRANTSATLTDVDDLVIARAAEGLPPYPALETLRTAAQTAAQTQGERIAAIQARLPQA